MARGVDLAFSNNAWNLLFYFMGLSATNNIATVAMSLRGHTYNSIQKPFRASPPQGGRGASSGEVETHSFFESSGEVVAYDSFIDIDGFPASSFSPSSRSSVDASGWMGGVNNRSFSSIKSNNSRISTGLVEDHQMVDWPVEEPSVSPVFRRLEHCPPSSQAPTARDQQIFRLASASGSASMPSYSGSRGSDSAGHSGGEEKRSPNRFESFEAIASNNSAIRSRDFMGGGSGKSKQSASILDDIAEVVAVRAAADPASSLKPRSGIVNYNRRDVPGVINSRRDVPDDQQHVFRNQGNTPKSVGNNSHSLGTHKPSENSTAGYSQHNGVVSKFVTMFSSKTKWHQEQNPSSKRSLSSPKPKPINMTNGGFNHSSKTVTTGVQFHVSVAEQSSSQAAVHSASSLFTMTSNNNALVPAISPARSNAQSSHSGDSSSYIPTGWPGTVDKRGRTYTMQPSYSESEESSLASPQRLSSNRSMVAGDKVQQHLGPIKQASCANNAAQVVHGSEQQQQQQRHQLQQQQFLQSRTDQWGFSTVASGEDDWLKGSVVDGMSIYDGDLSHSHTDLEEICNNEREIGPRGLLLANISMAKTAADFQLEESLETATNSFQYAHHNTSRGGSRSCNSPPTTNPMLDEESKLRGIDLSGSETRVLASGKRLSSSKAYNEEVVDFDCSFNLHNNLYPPKRMQQLNGPQPLSEELLRIKDRQSAPPRKGGSLMLRGYRGFIDKTKDVPNLMDDAESEASPSSMYSKQHANVGLALPAARGIASGHRSSLVSSSNNVDSQSDVFDGIQEEPFGPIETEVLNVTSEVAKQQQSRMIRKNEDVLQPFEGENLPYSTQFNPFTANCGSKQLNNGNARQSSVPDAEFIDPPLNLSAVSKGSSDTFSYHVDDFEVSDEESQSLPDLSIYYIQPDMVRKMVRAFRKMCTSQLEISNTEEKMLSDFENLVDTKKAFALFEMRSRIMETDIDRGLERRGGTNVLDDIVLTPYFQAAARVRDAVIVSKAWRDGATPKDVITAHFLTRRSARAHFVCRPIQRIWRPGVPLDDHQPQYWFEEVKWLDDTDFMLMRCQSLGAGTMKGFEMFTIGDCHSMLLKMTSDNCMVITIALAALICLNINPPPTRIVSNVVPQVLRRALRSAMTRQIEAEELMQDEIDLDGDENVFAEAEQLFRDATLEVRSFSGKLVLADKAFALARNRMQNLVQTIESLLVKIGHVEEFADGDTSSTMQSDYESVSYASQESQESQDRRRLVDRAKRAELSAEVAVREARLAKEEAEKIKCDKQREIDDLKVR